jgi:hypothetical protein
MYKYAIATFIGTFFSLTSHALRVTIAAQADSSINPTISGTSNLPDGTALMITVTRSQIGFEGSGKTQVYGGKFQAGPFGPTTGFTPGLYKLEVMMPIPSVQSNNVREVMGQKGEKLMGALVKQSEFREKYVAYTTSFKIAGQVDAKRDVVKRRFDEDNRRFAFCSDGCRIQAGGTSYSFQACMNACMKP